MPSSLSFFIHMVPLFSLLLSFMLCSSNAQGLPSPGYYLSSKVSTISFDQGFRNLWGPQHEKLDQESLSIWLDSHSGI
jgi:xyloglucan:xyloglucosyl transferase